MTAGQGLFSGADSQKPEVAHTHKAIRQDVQQKTADKFLRVESVSLYDRPPRSFTVVGLRPFDFY